jgi:imidazolonepropionase-like amidohydrolase
MITTLAFFAAGLLQSSPTAIEHVDVIPAHRNVVLQDQTVFLENGRIVALAPSAVVEVPDGCQTIDGAGKYLVPGYVDSHAHFPGTDAADIPVELYLQMMVEAGVTRLRCMRLPENLPSWATKIQSGEVFGPTLHYPVALFSSRENLERGHLESILEKASQNASADGVPFAKMLGGFAPKTYRQLMALCNKHGIKVAGHLPHGVGLEAAAETGQLGVEHLHGFERKKEYSHAEMQRLLKLSNQAGIYHCPTIFWIAVQGGELSEEQLNQLAGVERLPLAVTDEWRLALAATEQINRRPAMKFNRDIMTRILKQMAASGGHLLISASDGEFVVPGHSLHEEVKIYQEADVTPFQILQAATYNAARFFESTDQWGSIQPGLRADLVLLNSNPLDNPANLKDIAMVFVGGCTE